MQINVDNRHVLVILGVGGVAIASALAPDAVMGVIDGVVEGLASAVQGVTG